jgi:hypothetical protein
VTKKNSPDHKKSFDSGQILLVGSVTANKQFFKDGPIKMLILLL